MPISYGDAQPLLAALGGPVAPPEWRGALPITYHIGPGPASVHLSIQSDWSRKPAYNVIAKIPGAAKPDEWVVRGNHRDGWVFGAGDPLSGHVAMMAEAKAIGALLKDGWRPKRTIVYASWDGEEPGLLGSTEWAEGARRGAAAQGRALHQFGRQHARLPVGRRQPLAAAPGQRSREGREGSADRGEREGAPRCAQHGEGLSTRALRATTRTTRRRRRAGADFTLGALGSGSDFTPFLQHLGLTTLNIGYGGEDDTDGVYHSNYDSFDHYARFGDPGFVYGVAAGADGRPRWCCASRMRTCCRWSSAASPTRSTAT